MSDYDVIVHVCLMLSLLTNLCYVARVNSLLRERDQILKAAHYVAKSMRLYDPGIKIGIAAEDINPGDLVAWDTDHPGQLRRANPNV